MEQCSGELSITVLLYSPYSTGLALSDFFLFSKMKRPSKGRRLQMVSMIGKRDEVERH